MNNFEALVPGAQVRGLDGILGIVEQVDSALPDRGAAEATVLVRGLSGGRYRLPLALVRDVTEESGRPVVLVAAGISDLAQYAAGAADRAGTLAAEAGVAEAMEDGETLRVPVAAEELVVEKRPFTWGTVRLHKRVETAQQNITVPVYHEEAVIEHISPDDFDAGAPPNPDEVIIPIVEEQIVVEKRSVIKEYIRVRKSLVAQQQDVSDLVRREYVEVEQPART